MQQDDVAILQKKRGITLLIFILFILISFSLLLISTQSFAINIQEYGRSLFSGIRFGIDIVTSTISRSIGSIKELTTLRKEYRELVERYSHFEIMERDVAEIRQENARLMEQLGYSAGIKYKNIPARIIGEEPNNIFSAFVIDKGSRHGIHRNMPVIAYQNGTQGLLGKIVQVSRSESLMMPIYDLSSNISVRLVNSRYEGILFGQGDEEKTLLVRYIKKRAREDISYGDIVVTSGLGGIFPSDIIVGRIINVSNREYDTSLELELESPFDISRIEYIFIIDAEEKDADD